jgi:hypothetical protein
MTRAVKVGDVVAFNNLRDAVWWDVLKVHRVLMLVREHGTCYAPQLMDQSLVKKIKPEEEVKREARKAREQRIKARKAVPEPVDRDIRICFAIAWFLTPEDAEAFAKANPSTYNGGLFHGRATGRDPSWDREVDGVQQYAATY